MIGKWVGLEFRHLIALQAVAEEGKFTEAARRLGYTPSAVSQQIASLERIVGTPVIAREGRKALGPTEAGRVLLCQLSAIEARLGTAQSDIDALLKGTRGAFRVGAYESVGRNLLPEIASRFREQHPDVRVELVDATLDLELLRSLEKGVLDIVFTTPPLPPGPFDTRVLFPDPWVLVVSAASQIASSPPTTLTELAELPLICFRSPRAIDRVIGRFRAAGIEANVVLRSDYNQVVQEYAAIDFGAALMPRLAVNEQDERTVIISLSSLIPSREVAVTWHREGAEGVAHKAFLDLAIDVSGRHAASDSHARRRRSAAA